MIKGAPKPRGLIKGAPKPRGLMEVSSERRGEVRELLTLAWPLMIGYAGNTLLGFVDTAMVGRLGAGALGAVSLGNSLFFALTLTGMGIVSGMDPLASQALGAGRPEEARRVLWQGLRVATWLSVPLMALILLFSLGLEPFGVAHDESVATRDFLFGRLLNCVPFLWFSASRSYLQATGHTRPIVVSMIVANAANFVFNALFIYGDRSLTAIHLPAIGLPAMGVFGAGLSSTLASFLTVAVVAAGVRAVPAGDDPARRARDRDLVRRILRVGTPVGGQLLAEVGIFTLVTLFAGRMGKLPVAGHNIALSLASFTFTVTLGIAAATTVRVGKAVGRGDTPGARRAGFTGLAASSAFMAVAALAFLTVPVPLIHILTNQPEVVAAALPLVQIAAVFQLSDGAQVTMTNALRGAGDTKFSQAANLLGHYGIGLPVALALGLGVGLGAPGLWWGLSAGLSAVAIALTYRFHWLSKRPIARS